MATTSVPEAEGAPPGPPLSGLERGTLRELLVHGPKSRAEIARELGMSRASLTRVTRTLMEQGLVTDGAVELRGATGRPSGVLHIRSEGRRFLGVKLTGDRLFAVVTDLTAQALAEHDEPLASRSVEDAVAQIGGAFERLAGQHPGIAAVGIGLAGDVAFAGGRQIVRKSPFLGWREDVLRAFVEHGLVQDGDQVVLRCRPRTEAAMLEPIFRVMDGSYRDSQLFDALRHVPCPYLRYVARSVATQRHRSVAARLARGMHGDGHPLRPHTILPWKHDGSRSPRSTAYPWVDLMQKPCASTSRARLKRERKFSQAMSAVSSTSCAASKYLRSSANKASSTWTGQRLIASA
jgi:DNA-binding Lrp family transcriptional regulator